MLRTSSEGISTAPDSAKQQERYRVPKDFMRLQTISLAGRSWQRTQLRCKR